MKTVLDNLNIVTATPVAAAPAPVVNTAPMPKTVTLAEGTMVPVRLVEEIDTKTAKAGDTFHATTASNLTLLNYNVVPTGTTVTGRVAEAKPAGRLSGAAELTIELVSIRLNTPSGPQDVSVVTTRFPAKPTDEEPTPRPRPGEARRLAPSSEHLQEAELAQESGHSAVGHSVWGRTRSRTERTLT